MKVFWNDRSGWIWGASLFWAKVDDEHNTVDGQQQYDPVHSFNFGRKKWDLVCGSGLSFNVSQTNPLPKFMCDAIFIHLYFLLTVQLCNIENLFGIVHILKL